MHTGDGWVWRTALVFVAAFAVLFLFADGNGYEGDDLNSVIPMLNLPAYLDDPSRVYKYDWQPLAYWAGYAAYSVFGSIGAIFLLPQIAVAAGIALLWLTVSRHVGLSGLLFVPLLMMFPEILYTGLYVNSSALGYPLAVLAVLLAFAAPGLGGAVGTGVCLGLAVVMRFDFALVVPAILLFRLYLTSRFGGCVVAGLIAAAVVLGAVWVGLMDPARMVAIYEASRAEIVERTGDGGWNAMFKLRVATVIFSPIGWAFLGAALVYLLATGDARFRGRAALMVLALGPFLYSMQNLLSVKYMVPLFALLPVWAAMVWTDFRDRVGRRVARPLAAVWGVATAALIAVAVEPEREAPYLRVAIADPTPIGTHDGARTWGAYLTGLMRVEHRPLDSPQARRIAAADALVATLLEPGDRPDVWLIGRRDFFAPGGVGWNMVYARLERLGYPGDVRADVRVDFALPSGRLVVASPGVPVPDGVCAVDMAAVEDTAAHVARVCRD